MTHKHEVLGMKVPWYIGVDRISSTQVLIEVACRNCEPDDRTWMLDDPVSITDFMEWRHGKALSDAMPQLSPEDRYMLLIGLCPKHQPMIGP